MYGDNTDMSNREPNSPNSPYLTDKFLKHVRPVTIEMYLDRDYLYPELNNVTYLLARIRWCNLCPK
jgi:hypothetical protein